MTELQLITPQSKDIGAGFTVRRSLPSPLRQAVGPFVFFDHFGPITALPTDNHDIRPHPHIGLATVTYLFEGAMMHRDSTSVAQRIEPGAINWMTAGRGIVHSERTPDDLRGHARRSHGLQLWAALPVEHEEVEPSFEHTPAAAIPKLRLDGVDVRVLIGSAFGAASPVRTLSPTLYLDFAFHPGAAMTVLAEAPQRAIYSVDEGFELDGRPVAAFNLAVLQEGSEPRLRAPLGARIVLIGGAPLGHRFIVWNFVSSRRDLIAAAQRDWEERRFDAVPGETEFIPLPKRPN